MPPKKSARSRSSGGKMLTTSDYSERLEDSVSLEPSIRSVVSSLMFTSGDDENPDIENEDFVVNILKNELILLFEDIQAVHNKKVTYVKLEHMLPMLISRRGIISRFIKYLKNRVEMAAFMKAKSFSVNSVENICGQDIEMEEDDEKNEKLLDDDVDPIDELGDVGGAEGEYLRKKRKKLNTVTSEEDLLEEVKKAFSDAKINFEAFENEIDEKYQMQIAALQYVIDDMSGEDYNRFASARRTSFQMNSPVTPIYSSMSVLESKKRKRSSPRNNRQLLISWLGNPPVLGESVQVFVAFLAKEIVFDIVGSALLERRRLNPAEGGPLRHSFYEEPLRKNILFRKYGRLLI